MGYRSEVAYVINFDGEETRDEFIAMVKTHGDNLYKALQECQILGGHTTIDFYADHTKWYDGYKDVDAHHQLMQFAEEHYEGRSGWRFIRIGEEEGDIQNDSDSLGDFTPDDDFYTYSSFETPFSKSDFKSMAEVEGKEVNWQE